MGVGKMLLRLLVALFAIFHACKGECLTTEEGPKKSVPCALPWKFNNKLIEGCTTETDPDGRWWCSTKVDRELNHIGGQGNWGYCNLDCPGPAPPVTQRKNKVPDLPGTKFPELPEDLPGTKFPELPEPNGITNQTDGRYHPNENDGTCGEYLGTGFIIGGKETKRGELPYQAVLGYRRRRKTKYNCGGTLINRRYVITAAHCQHKKIPRLQIREVVIGDWDLEHDPDCAGDDGGCRPGSPFKKVQRFDVTNNDIKVHEKWDLNKVVDQGNDIALIRLPRLAETFLEDFDQIVAPVCLGWDNTIKVPDFIDNPDAKYLVSGWGRTNNDAYDRGDIGVSGAHSSKLLKLTVPRIPLDQCKADFPIFKDLTLKQICAGGIKGQDSCSGDSGGPLVATDTSVAGPIQSPKYLVGIVSFGTKKCGQGYPGVYSSIRYYLPWIIANMEQ